MSSRLSLFAAGGMLATAMAISPMLAAPAAKTETESTTTTPEKIKKALDSTQTFEYKDQNLNDIITSLGEHYKIPIVLDKAMIANGGLLPEDLNVTISLKNVKFRTALRNMLVGFNLTYVIADGALVITSEELAIGRQLKQRIELNFDNVPLQTAMKELSSKYGVSVLFDPKVIKAKTSQNPVTAQLEDVPFEAAVRLLCEMADLKPARMGNVIFITTEARADKLKESDSLVPPPPAVPNPFGPGFMLGNLGFAGGGAFGGAVAPARIAPEAAETPKDAPKDLPVEKKDAPPQQLPDR